VQRRHQKVIEESPSPGVDTKLRHRITEAATAAAAALGYVNAGTVEFLLDGDQFYFIEVNARLQVEHPVTEMITGLDLVEQQLRIAEGVRLGASIGNVTQHGHAVECRVGAEDPHHDFLPSQGTIAGRCEPGGPGIRVDSGLSDGLTVSRHFDPLLAKVIAWGVTRDEALGRMGAALEEMQVSGVCTTLPFLRWAIQDKCFRTGRYDVRFAEGWEHRKAESAARLPAVIAAALWTHERRRGLTLPDQVDESQSRWRRTARLEAAGSAEPGTGP
jgi:acetyl/propionyl-CoA carboxylase alpha subunit